MTGPGNWKPKRCADCNARHPSFNRDGAEKGTPWRCRPCHDAAQPLPRNALGHIIPPGPQGSLL